MAFCCHLKFPLPTSTLFYIYIYFFWLKTKRAKQSEQEHLSLLGLHGHVERKHYYQPVYPDKSPCQVTFNVIALLSAWYWKTNPHFNLILSLMVKESI